MAIKTERLQLRVDIDTAEGVRNLTALQEKYDLLIQKNKEAKGDDKSTTAKAAIEAKEALDKERESLGLIGLTLKELKQLQRELNIEKNRYNEGTDQYNKANTELNIVKTRIKELSSAQHSYNQELLQTVKTQGVQALSLQHLREYYKLLKKEIEDTADFESEANKKRIADSQNIAQMITQKEGAISGTTSFFGQIKQQLPSAVAGAFGGMFVGVAGMAAEALIGAFSNAVDSIKKRARDITDIEVSLNTTRENATKIKSDLNNIKTESSVDELKKLVVVAGDLNVAEKDIKSFIVEADKVGVVLASDFGGNVEEAITMIAKLKGEFKDTRDLNYSESLAKIGSVLKQLNLDGPASTQGITDFLKRVGAIPDAIKPTLPQLAAFGAVFEEANLSAEIAGSGFSKILTVAANNAEIFGKQMNMTKKEIENLINTNPNEFVIKFAQSLKGLSGTDTAKTLKSVKLESDEVLKVVGVLSDNIGKLTEKQQSANQTFAQGTVTTEIFNKYLDDEAGKISQIGKAWSRVGGEIVNTLAKISGPTILWLANMTEKGKTVEETFEQQNTKVKNLESTLPNLITRYQELTKDGKLSAQAQQELNGVMAQIGTIVPKAISDFDDYGRALKINLGIVNDYLKKQKEINNNAKNELVLERRKEIADNAKHIKLIQEQLKTGQVIDYEIGIYTKTPKPRALKDEEIKKNQKQLAEFQAKNKAAWEEYKLLFTERDINTPTNTTTDDKKDGKDGKSNLGTGTGKGKNTADARAKYLQESQKQMLEIKARLDFDDLQATADAEQKRLNLVNKHAEDEIKRVQTQFKNERGIILKESQLTQEQRELIKREIEQIQESQEKQAVAINEEFAQKREAQILEQTNRAIQLVQDAKQKELQATLKTAQRKGTAQDIFNAQEAILFNNQEISLANLKVKYDKEKEALKDNKEALAQLDKNYGKEKSNIINQNLSDWELLIGEFYRNVERAKKANLEKLRLDVSEAELNGQDPTQAKIALLNAEMQAELSVANLTEAEKTNIVRRFAQERQAIERNSMQAVLQQAIELYSQAFAGISSIARTELNNRETAENEKYNSQKQRVEELESAGTYSKAKAKFEQTKIEKAHNREISKIRYEQAKIDKAANISQATINGIQAVMKAYAQTGILGGPVAAAIIGGITAYQIGQMIAQPLPKIEGSFFKGGAMPNIFQNPVDEKGGGLIIAHPNEFMIPEWIRQEPIFANIEPVIQHMIDTGRSYYNGGPVLETTKPSTDTTRPNQDITPILNRLVNFLEQNISMQEEIINGVRNIQINVGYEAAEKILDAGNEIKNIKKSAKP